MSYLAKAKEAKNKDSNNSKINLYLTTTDVREGTNPFSCVPAKEAKKAKEVPHGELAWCATEHCIQIVPLGDGLCGRCRGGAK